MQLFIFKTNEVVLDDAGYDKKKDAFNRGLHKFRGMQGSRSRYGV